MSSFPSKTSICLKATPYGTGRYIKRTNTIQAIAGFFTWVCVVCVGVDWGQWRWKEEGSGGEMEGQSTRRDNWGTYRGDIEIYCRGNSLESMSDPTKVSEDMKPELAIFYEARHMSMGLGHQPTHKTFYLQSVLITRHSGAIVAQKL